MLTTKQFSKASGVPVGTLKRWRSKFKGSDEGRQGVLMPATVDEHGTCLYDESQIEIARRLHNPNYGQPKIIEVNDMTENTALDAQIDAQAANQAVDDQTPADAQNDATSDGSDVVTIDTQGEIVTLEQRAEKIRRLQADVQRGIIEIGFELIAAKAEVGHGNWAEWLETEFQWSDRTARYFMSVAQRFGNRNTYSDLKPSTLKAMLTLPVGSEDEFIAQQAEAGKPVNEMSTREVKAAVKEFNQRKDEHTDDDVQRFGKLNIDVQFEPSTNATDADDVQSHVDDDGEDGPIDGEKICDRKISAIVTATADDDDSEEIADVPNHTVHAQIDDSDGDDGDDSDDVLSDDDKAMLARVEAMLFSDNRKHSDDEKYIKLKVKLEALITKLDEWMCYEEDYVVLARFFDGLTKINPM